MGLLKKINIGLDIGVSSVGWSIIDEDYEIIDMGVRLFDDPMASNGKTSNFARRNARHIRRIYSRKKNRRTKFINLLISEKFVSSEEDFYNKVNIDINNFGFDNPIHLKEYALNHEISQDKLVFLLFYYLHHRGYFYLKDEELKKMSYDQIQNDKSMDKNKFPTHKQCEIIKKNKGLLTPKIYDGISNKDWINEIKNLLKKQKCSEKFIEKYLNIFSYCHKFNEGPKGDENHETHYGLWKKNKETQKISKISKNLWDINRGYCSYYYQNINEGHSGKKRGHKNAPITELFNLINGLSNIVFTANNEKICKKITSLIIKKIDSDFFTTQKQKFSIKEIFSKICSEHLSQNSENFVSNIDELIKNGSFSDLRNYKLIAHWLKDVKKFDGTITILNKDLLAMSNDLFEKMSSETFDILSRMEWLKQNFNEINNDKKIFDFAKKISNLSSTSSLSYDAMQVYIDYFLKLKNDEICDNWTIFSYKKPAYFLPNKENNIKHLAHDLLKNEIVSPTVRRSFNQARAIINKILDIYCNQKNKNAYKLDNITIELPRDKNSYSQKVNLEKYNKHNKDLSKKIGSKNSKVIERYKLWIWQEKIDLYDGLPIEEEDVLSGNKLEIDHIIPKSISLDDSYNNKLLTKKINNQDKGKRTPLQYLKNGEKEKYVARINKLFANHKGKNEKEIYNDKKKSYLLYEGDPLKNIHLFINRNLVDTRYASKLVYDKIKTFFNNNIYYPNVKIKVVRGKTTSFMRNNIFVSPMTKKTYLHKNRNLFCHHAIDASLICFLGMNKKIDDLIQMSNYLKFNNKSYEIFVNDNKKQICWHNDETNEDKIISIDNLYDDNKKNNDFANQLLLWSDRFDDSKKFISSGKVHFSRKIISHNNICLFDILPISLRKNKDDGSWSVVKKISLFDKKINVFFENNNKKCESLFIKKNNRDLTLFKKLKEIYEKYKNGDKDTTPFYKYMQQNYGDSTPTYLKIDENILKNNLSKCRKIKNLFYELKNYKSFEDFPGIIKSLKHQKNAGIQAFENLQWLSLYVYKFFNTNKLVIFPINAHVLNINKNKPHKLEIDKTLFTNKLKEKNITQKNAKLVFILRRGSVLIDNVKRSIYYVVGYSKSGLEIKPIDHIEINLSNQKKDKPKRTIITLNQLFENYSIAEVDILGKIYNRKKICEI